VSFIGKLTSRVKRAAKERKKREAEHAQDAREHEFETWNRAKAPERSAGHDPFGRQ
jgi:hypothetical protein